MATGGFCCNCVVSMNCASWELSSITEICTNTPGTDICWFNGHSLISAWFELTWYNQCGTFVSEVMQTWQLMYQNFRWITTCLSASYLWKTNRVYTIYKTRRFYVGGRVGQGCKNSFCRQRIIHIPRTPRINSGCSTEVVAI